MHILGGEIQDPVLNVRSVAVLSDIHLGASNCVLGEGSTLTRFSAFLEANDVNVDAFVFNGDMCDFALATMSETITHTAEFLAVLTSRCRDMIYVPGNHDHHSWLLANELHEFLRQMPNPDPSCVERTERMYRSTYLKTLLRDQDRDIFIAYPNLYWQPPGADRIACIFHHGHFCEELYSIVSDTLTAAFPEANRKDLEFVESVNFGWLELIWYQLGQTGKGLGAHGLIEHLYERIQRDGPDVLADGIGRLYTTRIRPILHRALKQEADEKWWLTKGMAEHVAAWIDKHAPSVVIALLTAYAKHKIENKQPGASDWRFRTLDDDLAQHCLAYIERSKSSRFLPSNDRIAFFFGHTHAFGTWPSSDGQTMLYNDGGWIRKSDNGWPDAHVFVIDERGSVKDLYFGERDSDCTVTQL
jgi:hypothetical protein